MVVMTLLAAIFFTPCDAKEGAPDESQKPTLRPNETYEILRPDSAWCGPRIVYFFACYAGEDCTLEQVVKLCKTESNGTASMLQLVEAARALNLDPTPVQCSTDELLTLGGPAIIAV